MKEIKKADHWLASRLPFFYGWVMVPIAILATVATSPGQTFGVSIFNPSFREALGLTHSQLTGAYMAGTLLAALPQPYIGGLMDRAGIRRMMTIVVTALGVACLFVSQVSSLFMLFVGFLLLRTFGQGALTLLASNTTAMWFQRRLGSVSGIVSVGVSIINAMIPAFILWLITQFGWRWTYALLGMLVWIVMFPILRLFFQNRPEDIGQQVDGELSEAPTNPAAVQPPDSAISLDLRTAQHSRAYWIMAAITAAWGMVITAILFNIIPVFTSRGLTEAQAAAIFATQGLAGAGFQLLGGFLADRTPLNWLAAASMTALSAAVWVLMGLAAPWQGHLFAALAGVGGGLFGVTSGTLWARYYGRAHLGKIRGTIWTAAVAGSSVGPFLMGYTFDRLGSYDISLQVFLGLLVVLTVASLWATPPTPETNTLPSAASYAAKS